MSLRKMSSGTLLFSAVVVIGTPLRPAEAQDVDVPGNLTMHDSTDATVGNVLKEGVPFLHNFGTNNTFLGSNAGNFTLTGSENTALGAGALTSNTIGLKNTATGVNALFQNTEGAYNSAAGHSALNRNTTGVGNVAVGFEALRSNTTGGLNVASGYQVLVSNTNGGGNVASGYLALESNTFGSNNTAIGTHALDRNTIGNTNTATGALALGSNATGSFNSAFGYLADVSERDLTNATAIGHRARVDASNKIRLGNSDVTVIEGEVPYTYTSDRNEKENLRAVDAEAVLGKLRRLSVTSWNYKGQDAKQFRHYGPVAQDFFAAFGHDAVGTVGTPTTISSGDLDGILMIAAQALEKRAVEQRKMIDALRVENADLKARLEALERRVGSEVAANAKAGL